MRHATVRVIMTVIVISSTISTSHAYQHQNRRHDHRRYNHDRHGSDRQRYQDHHHHHHHHHHRHHQESHHRNDLMLLVRVPLHGGDREYAGHQCQDQDQFYRTFILQNESNEHAASDVTDLFR